MSDAICYTIFVIPLAVLLAAVLLYAACRVSGRCSEDERRRGIDV